MKKSQLSKSSLTKFLFEFIEHTIGFVYLTLMIIKTRNAQEPEFLSLARLKQSALIIRPRTHFSEQIQWKCLDIHPNRVTIYQKIMNEL